MAENPNNSNHNSFSSPMKSPFKETPIKTPERLSDRYISNRDSQDLEMSAYILTAKENTTPASVLRRSANKSNMSGGGGSENSKAAVCNGEPYSTLLAKSLFPEESQTTVLGLNNENLRNVLPQSLAPSQLNRYTSSLAVVYNENKARNFMTKSFRVIPQTPERILDAPELMDDFYLNLIDWSSKNILTVALSQTVYLWNADNGDIQQLMSTEDKDNIVTGVCWHAEGNILAVGTNDNEVQLWDTTKQQLLRTITGHTARVGALTWNGPVLASGSRDSTIRLHDLRCSQPSQTILSTGHTQEVCGLRWSPNGQYLASGGNDNLLNIWDARGESLENRPILQFRDHIAAIKALAWNPVQNNLLVSGGGTADKTLRFWDISSGTCIHVVDTKSQVCGALWSRNGTELATSHGYSDNQLTLWKYPSLKRITDLTGHSSRVLHLTMSPDGQTVVSAAGDETIRFWRCFGNEGKTRQKVPDSLEEADAFNVPLR